MPVNKNQHFVPRALLKPFTLDAAGKAISLFNSRSKAYKLDVALKHQCSKDNFYDKDPKLQNAIEKTEVMYALLRDAVISSAKTNAALDFRFFSTFWLFQHMRTEAASKYIVAMSEDLRNKAKLAESKAEFTLKDAIQISMDLFSINIDIVDDYAVCILKNKTSQPFITSDDPAIQTNRWFLQDRRNSHRAIGHGTAGNLIMFPISPHLLFLGYDRDVYKITSRNGWVDVKSEDDVTAINQFQYLNFHHNLYFDRKLNHDFILNQFQTLETLRPSRRHKINIAIGNEQTKEYTRYDVIGPTDETAGKEVLLHTQVIYPSPSKWPSIIKWKRKGTYYSNDTGKGLLRRAVALRENTSYRQFTKREIGRIQWK